MPPQEQKPYYTQVSFWIAILDLVLILSLGIWQGCTNKKIAEYEATHVPQEEVKPVYPATVSHDDITKAFESEIIFSYSGEQIANYFIEWYATNPQGKMDDIAPMTRKVKEAIPTIKEGDGKKTEIKEYKFLKKGIYTITATIYYYSGTLVGSTEEEAKEYIKTNGKSVQVTYKVKAGEEF